MKKGVFYRLAIFFTTEEVVKLLKKTGFKDFELRQTIFNNLDKITQVEKIKKGYGEGSFIAIRAKK